MKNPFSRPGQFLKKLNDPQPKLKISSCGEILIDGLPFSFTVASAGSASDKGLVVSFSGEAVDKGIVTFEKIEAVTACGQTAEKTEKNPEFITKKDGKRIYQTRFTDLPIPAAAKSPGFRLKRRREDFFKSVSSEIAFRTVPHYSLSEECEIMITVYPIAAPLNGLSVIWKSCTSDKDYFTHRDMK